MKPVSELPEKERSNVEEEVAHYDDRTIDKALRWSGVVLVLIVLGAGAVYWNMRQKKAPAQTAITKLSAPTAPAVQTANIPDVRFRDVTEASGIKFQHFNGATGEKLLPETMGGGVAFLDFDNDGDQDLLFVNSAAWPWSPPPGANPIQALYANDGKGAFKDVTVGSGLDVSFYGMGAAVGDYDNDGNVDILLTGVGGNKLFRNLGAGKFEDVTARSGVGGTERDWSTAAAWVDYDNDGRLDLFVTHYVRWSREIDHEVGFKLVGVGRAYGQPMNFQGAYSALYRNQGDGTFQDVSEKAGIQVRNAATGVPAGKGLGVSPVDLDGDGWIDLVVANDTVQNFVFHNQRDGTFKEIGAACGMAYDNYGKTRGAMGIDAGRFRDDDAMGILIANFATEMTALYVSQRSPLLYADEAITEAIGPAGLLLLKFGVFFFDYDLDGRLDVLTCNGHLEEEIEKIQHQQKYRQPAQLFWNSGPGAGNGCFVSVPAAKCGEDLFQPIVGRGSAYADIDSDGDLDVVLTQVGGRPLLLRNERGGKAKWVRLKLVGDKTNRDAIGAWVKATVGERTLWRHVMPTRSYLSQSELPVTIGLGQAERLDALEVIWPGGKTQPVGPVPLGQTFVVREAERTAAR